MNWDIIDFYKSLIKILLSAVVDEKKGNIWIYLVDYILKDPFWKTVWGFLQILRVEPPFNPTILFTCVK